MFFVTFYTVSVIILFQKTKMVDYAFKVIVVGQAGVGKTAIVRRFIKKYFPEGEHPTIGVDIGVKMINVGDKKVQVKRCIYNFVKKSSDYDGVF